MLTGVGLLACLQQPMPKITHEALVELVRGRPSLAGELLQHLGLLEGGGPVEATSLDTDLSQVVPTGYRADNLVRISRPRALIGVVEVQMRPDPRKRRSWAVYVAESWSRDGLPVALIVFTLDPRTERWASVPIEMGFGSVIQPIVVGPSRIPLVTDPAEARAAPELAILSVLAHPNARESPEIGLRAADAVGTLDEARGRLYLDLMLAALPAAARRTLEDEMIPGWQPQSEFLRRLDAEGFRRGVEQGIEQGIERGIEQGIEQGHMNTLRVMLSRQINLKFGAVPADVAERIEEASSETLERWAEQLVAANTLEEVFEEG